MGFVSAQRVTCRNIQYTNSDDKIYLQTKVYNGWGEQ